MFSDHRSLTEHQSVSIGVKGAGGAIAQRPPDVKKILELLPILEHFPALTDTFKAFKTCVRIQELVVMYMLMVTERHYSSGCILVFSVGKIVECPSSKVKKK